MMRMSGGWDARVRDKVRVGGGVKLNIVVVLWGVLEEEGWVDVKRIQPPRAPLPLGSHLGE